MKNNKIHLLDCTLRDGCYIVDAEFGAAAIRGIIEKLQDANTDIIECGWLKDKPHKYGTSFYHIPSDLEQYLTEKDKNKIYTVMIDWDRYNLDTLPECDGKSIDAIRVVFPYGRHKEGAEVGRRIKEKGYKVFFQAANTLAYDNDDLVELARTINTVEPVALSVVDTFGAMYNEDLDRIVSVLNKELSPEIMLGFHSHNNQQLSFSLSIHFIELLTGGEREIVVDSSLCGMGRGAGNATTELIVSYLNKKQDCHYDLDAVMDAIDTYMGYFQANYRWGYSTPYFIAGLYCCHVNNIAYLTDSHRTNAKDMRLIIESMSPEDRKKYDYDLLESKYIENQSRYVDDSAAVSELKSKLAGKSVVIIAPGKTSVTDKEKIRKYIADNNSVVIGVNAIVPDYKYDYLFFVNSARFDYAKKVARNTFDNTKRILLSNIKNQAGRNEIIIDYNHAIKRGWKHFDNAVICCLRFLDYAGIDNASIAGFDGFKTKYNESYADPYLPTLNPKNNWSELNDEIIEMFADFRESAKHCTNISFITDSLFEG